MKRELIEFNSDFPNLTHYSFRYPAKFHPPVARYLLEQFTSQGDAVLDPFCGSGTLLVEGVAIGRNMVGVDVDPVAAFVSLVKSSIIWSPRLSCQTAKLLDTLNEATAFGRGGIPPIPNITHWFNSDVLESMRKLSNFISRSDSLSPDVRNIALCAFLSCVRNWSNADPVPVSGLEVTSYIKSKRAELGHNPDVFGDFKRAFKKIAKGIEELGEIRSGKSKVYCSDSEDFLRNRKKIYDAIITSPPYLTAVDYYRRHTLEMYWLDKSMTVDKRINLRHKYIGQYNVTKSMGKISVEGTSFKSLHDKLREINPKRAAALAHYAGTMIAILKQCISATKSGGRVVFVVGNGKTAGIEVETGDLLASSIEDYAILERVIEYPLKNRYMTYSRRNHADIQRERIYAFKVA